jgi:hypothetical protein
MMAALASMPIADRVVSIVICRSANPFLNTSGIRAARDRASSAIATILPSRIHGGMRVSLSSRSETS